MVSSNSDVECWLIWLARFDTTTRGDTRFNNKYMDITTVINMADKKSNEISKIKDLNVS